MHHPLERIPVGKRRWVFVPFLVLTLGVLAALAWTDIPLRTQAAPGGIISFEVAGDVAHSRAMIDSWGALARIHAGFSLGLDYLFMPAYSTTIAMGCIWAMELFGRRRRGTLVELGRLLAWGQWVAAVLDATENAALLVQLRGAAVDPWPAVAWWCAVPKFMLLYAGITYALGGVVMRAVAGASRR